MLVKKKEPIKKIVQTESQSEVKEIETNYCRRKITKYHFTPCSKATDSTMKPEQTTQNESVEEVD